MDNKNFTKVFSERLKNLMDEANLTAAQLAEKIGVDENVINNLLSKNINCGVDILRKLVDFFDISTDYILGRVNGKYEYFGMKNLSWH